MKIIVDTNIIFSLLLNSSNTLGDLLFNSGTRFEFYSCSYMREEIRRHWKKLKVIAGDLWTGDRKLYEGLESKNFNKIVNTVELIAFRDGTR